MDAVQKPSNDLLLVYAKDGGGNAAEKLKGLGEVEELKGAENMFLLHLRQKTSDARSAWELVRERIGDEDIVYPVLLDEGGHNQYPTGEISVRFESPPTDAQLKRFAASHGLRLQSRNEFVPQQATFEPLKPGEQYIPELVEEIAGAKNTQLAWANTLSRYERS